MHQPGPLASRPRHKPHPPCCPCRRLYPLNQRDMPLERKQLDFGPLLPASVTIDNPSRDYTPATYISLLFTDLGVLTPAAVSDELIQLYVSSDSFPLPAVLVPAAAPNCFIP